MAEKIECELLVCSQWKPASITEIQYKKIRNELKGSTMTNKEYPICLSDGDIIDLGIIDGVRELWAK